MKLQSPFSIASLADFVLGNDAPICALNPEDFVSEEGSRRLAASQTYELLQRTLAVRFVAVERPFHDP